MADLFQQKAFEVIEQAVGEIPGVVSFANYRASSKESIQTKKMESAIEVQILEKNYKFIIHIVLMNGINVTEVAKEVQFRVSGELEKLVDFNSTYVVDVVVEDLVVL